MGRKKSKSSAYRINLATDHHKKSKEELVDECVDLIIENEKLKKKLRRYENPHTPPSKDERKSRTNFVIFNALKICFANFMKNVCFFLFMVGYTPTTPLRALRLFEDYKLIGFLWGRRIEKFIKVLANN
jgi:hypothetical protein